ncbi:MAG: GYF domain-containing protein [Planctomycetota bacterium]|jgi:hypothetical protein
MNEWYCTVDGARYGPVGLEELLDWARQGRLGADELVWKDGMSEWRPASGVAELSDAVWPIAAQPVGTAPLPAQPTRVQKANGLAIAGMVLGIISLVICIPYLSIPSGVTGLVLSIFGLKKARGGASGGGMAKTGLITSIIGMSLFVLILAIGLIAAWVSGRYESYE